MHRTHSNHPDQPDDGAPEPSVSPLPSLAEEGALVESSMRRLLDLTLQAQSWGQVQTEAGLTLHDCLCYEVGLPGWIAGQLLAVADRLSALPEVDRVFRDGVICFDQLARFVAATRFLHGERLAVMDAEAASLAVALAVQHRTDSWVIEVEYLVEDLRAPAHLNRAEKRAGRDDGCELSAQQDLDGGGRIVVDADRVHFTTIMTGIDDARDRDETSIRRARGQGLLRLVDLWMGATSTTTGPDGRDGDNDGVVSVTKAARPTLVAHLDLEHATTSRFAQLSRVCGLDRLPALDERLTAMLAEHADLILQLRLGNRPLLELADKDHGHDIPAPLRRAARNRDRGCRWPGCTVPMRLIQVHHVIHREHGGTDDLDNLLCLCALHHLRYVHRLGWTPTVDHDTGLVTWRRPGTRTRSSMPHGARPRPARDPSLLPDWLAPPRPPPPDNADPPGRVLPPDHWTDPPHDLDTALAA